MNTKKKRRNVVYLAFNSPPVNNFMQISADIWALCNKVLCDDPNESSTVYFQPYYFNFFYIT